MDKSHKELYFFQCSLMHEYYASWIKSTAAGLCAIAGITYIGVMHYDRKKVVKKKRWFHDEHYSVEQVTGHYIISWYQIEHQRLLVSGYD